MLCNVPVNPLHNIDHALTRHYWLIPGQYRQTLLTEMVTEDEARQRECVKSDHAGKLNVWRDKCGII